MKSKMEKKEEMFFQLFIYLQSNFLVFLGMW